MAKWMNDTGADQALNWFADVDRMVLCSQQPATYADLNTYKLAEAVPSFGALANGDVSGRKRQCQAKTAIVVSTTGTGNHIGLGKAGDSTLRYVDTCPNVSVVSGGTVDIGAWDIEIADPA
jgi:hypothetical protein